MGHAELYLTWGLLAANGIIAAATCWGTWRLHSALLGLRRHIFGYRENLD